MNFTSHDQIPYPTYSPNELNEQLIGMPALNPFFRSVSGPRAAMFNKHIAQRPTLITPDRQRLQTGVSFELGKYTYKKALPNDAYIIDTIPKYTKSLMQANDFKNPLTSVIFEHADTQVIDVLNLERFHSQHPYFGFEYKYNLNALNQVIANNRVNGDIVIADSPAKAPDGDYMYGVHANMALMSDPAVIEDGIKISESFARRLGIDMFEVRTINFNSNAIGLNIYGDKDNYKLFPNIGDTIRDDGIVFAVRDIVESMAPSDLSAKSLMRPTMIDTCTYGKPGAEVIDVEIIKGEMKHPIFLTGMDGQLEYYHHAAIRYYSAIYEAYRKVKNQYKTSLKLSFEFNALVRTAIAYLRANTGQAVLDFREKDGLNGWMVKVTYRYRLYPNLGYKLTDLMGGKGVICSVVPDEQMPVNKIGIRADIIMDNQAPYRRTIMGKFIELYINASLDVVVHNVKAMVKPKDPDSYLKAFDYVLGFYKIVSPPMYDGVINSQIDATAHIKEILADNIGLWLPPDNPVDYMEVIKLLQEYYPAILDKVNFKGVNGEDITTKSDILIGGCYMIMLDKIAVEAASVSSSRTQHFGIPSKLNKFNRYQSPTRDQPTKALAEDETRLLEATVGGRVTADLLDQTNNPDVHKAILDNIYRSETPSSIYRIVDRNIYPMGHGYIQNMVNNVLECAGLEFTVSKGVD